MKEGKMFLKFYLLKVALRLITLVFAHLGLGLLTGWYFSNAILGALVISASMFLHFLVFFLRGVRDGQVLPWSHDFSNYVTKKKYLMPIETLTGMGGYDKYEFAFKLKIFSKGIKISTIPMELLPSIFLYWTDIRKIREIYMKSKKGNNLQLVAEVTLQTNSRVLVLPWQASFEEYCAHNTEIIKIVTSQEGPPEKSKIEKVIPRT